MNSNFTFNPILTTGLLLYTMYLLLRHLDLSIPQRLLQFAGGAGAGLAWLGLLLGFPKVQATLQSFKALWG